MGVLALLWYFVTLIFGTMYRSEKLPITTGRTVSAVIPGETIRSGTNSELLEPQDHGELNSESESERQKFKRKKKERC